MPPGLGCPEPAPRLPPHLWTPLFLSHIIWKKVKYRRAKLKWLVSYVFNGFPENLKQSYNLCIRLQCMQWSNRECSPSVWSAAAQSFNEICKVNERLCAVLQITSAQQHTNSLHPPPPKIKSNWRFNALAKEVQNTFDTKHKKRPTHYKDTMRPQQAIRSNMEHICTTIMFMRSRILRVLPICY